MPIFHSPAYSPLHDLRTARVLRSELVIFSVRCRMVEALFVDINTQAYGLYMSNKERLDKTAWILAGFRALSARGPVALKAESLARELGVSKGSFYWHFANIKAFQVAMIDYWVAVATEGIIDAVDAGAETAAERLALLVQLATEPPPEEVGGQRAEGAIRCWGRADAMVAERLRAVDSARIDYCENLFMAHGLAAAKAQLHGRLLYGGLIGLEQLSVAELAQLRGDLQAQLRVLL